jgi:hypothetical protein
MSHVDKLKINETLQCGDPRGGSFTLQEEHEEHLSVRFRTKASKAYRHMQ